MIKRDLTDKYYEQYTANDMAMNETRFWQVVNKILLDIDSSRVELPVKPACENCESINELFEMQHKQMLKADRYWQEQTGKSNMYPDLAQLLKFLMDKVLSKSV